MPRFQIRPLCSLEEFRACERIQLDVWGNLAVGSELMTVTAKYGGALIGALCAVVGVYVVLRGLAFIGAGVAHASFGGGGPGFLVGINPVLTAVVFCLATAWGIGYVARSGQVRADTAIVVFFAFSMALGILFIGLMHGYNVDLFGYLFGSILAVGAQDLWITLALGAGVLLADRCEEDGLKLPALGEQLAERGEERGVGGDGPALVRGRGAAGGVEAGGLLGQRVKAARAAPGGGTRLSRPLRGEAH